jgi:hypothetical protein
MRADTSRACAVLTTSPIVLSLAMLIANDAWLEAGYPRRPHGRPGIRAS